MRNSTKLPYSLFFYGGLLCLLLSFFFHGTTDIHIQATYLVVANRVIMIALSLLFLFYWMVYVQCQAFLLSRIMIWMHFFIMILALLGALFANQTMQNNDTVYGAIDFSRYNMVTIMVVICLLFSILLFLFNVIGGAIRKSF